MRFYAQTPVRWTVQVLADLVALAWLLGGAWAASTLRDLMLLLGEPGEVLESAGKALNRRVAAAADTVDDVPIAGEQLRQPFDVVAEAGLDIAGAGARQQEVVGNLATALALTILAITIAVVLVGWLPWRLRWILRARAAGRLLTGSADLSLFALRALTNRPLRELHRIDADPLAAWRAGDQDVVRRLAALEIHSLGLRTSSGSGVGSPANDP